MSKSFKAAWNQPDTSLEDSEAVWLVKSTFLRQNRPGASTGVRVAVRIRPLVVREAACLGRLPVITYYNLCFIYKISS